MPTRAWVSIIVAVAGAAVAFATPAGAEGKPRYCLDGVCRSTCVLKTCLWVSTSQQYAIIEAENGFHVPIGVRVLYDRLQNVTSYPPGPVAALVGPGQSKQIVKLTAIRLGASYEFPFHWSFTYGDPSAKHDPRARYRMPFGGKLERELTQGQNGRFTHTGTSRYSFDFGMPIGTPILAARRGEVVEVNDGYTESGVAPAFLDKANAVTILHEDGTFATYAHLDPGSGVRQGMKVNVGDVLGFSGNTGFSTGPHLHFSVWRATMQNDQGSVTVPIRFYDSSAAGFVPRSQRRYAPTCHREGNRCKPGELPPRPASYGAAPIERGADGTCRCSNGSIITTSLPCRVVCP